jgi:hypothetical protein
MSSLISMHSHVSGPAAAGAPNTFWGLSRPRHRLMDRRLGQQQEIFSPESRVGASANGCGNAPEGRILPENHCCTDFLLNSVPESVPFNFIMGVGWLLGPGYDTYLK